MTETVAMDTGDYLRMGSSHVYSIVSTAKVISIKVSITITRTEAMKGLKDINFRML